MAHCSKHFTYVMHSILQQPYFYHLYFTVEEIKANSPLLCLNQQVITSVSIKTSEGLVEECQFSNHSNSTLIQYNLLG